MDRGRRVLRLLEGACAVITVLFATLLVLSTNYDALLITYRNGDLTSTITVFAVACVGWLGLRLARSPRRPAVGLLVGGACVVGLVAVLWWTTRPAAEEQHDAPAPGPTTPSAPPSSGP
ncbi:hypothetical protein ABZ922_06500 [Streptomyces shenzhenensis]|uniref:hypothetical protein n=1 Tax=Streptomyces shenzhenensis TaxID=943815 RepID=UPI0033E444C8